MLRREQILKLEEMESKQQPSATSTISNNESRTMRSAETQTELLECSSSGDEEGASSGDAVSVIDDELEVISTRALPSEEARKHGASEPDADDLVDDEDDYDEEILGENAKLKTIKRLNCTNLFNFNKLELLNERCSAVGAGQQQISDSSRNLCEHEMHVAIDEDLEQAAAAGEGKRTREDSAAAAGSSSSSAVIFIQESPEVIL